MKKIFGNLVGTNSSRQQAQPVETTPGEIKIYPQLFQTTTSNQENLTVKIIILKNKIKSLKINEEDKGLINELITNLELISEDRYKDIFSYKPYYEQPDVVKHDYIANSFSFKMLKIDKDDSYIEMIKTFLKLLHALGNSISCINQKSMLGASLTIILREFIEHDIEDEKLRKRMSVIISDFNNQAVALWDDGIGVISAPWNERLCNMLRSIIAETCKAKTQNVSREVNLTPR